MVESTKEPELPYAKVPEVTYVPLEGRKLQAESEYIPITEKQPPVFKTKAPIQNTESAAMASGKIMNAEIVLKAKDLLAISKETRDELRQAISMRRVPVDIHNESEIETENPQQVDSLPFMHKELEEVHLRPDAISIDELEEPCSVMITTIDTPQMPKDSIVVGDIVLQYLESIENEVPKQVTRQYVHAVYSWRHDNV
ncbi:hypothetical protein K435DRAFT_853895 [Dendrothele bispora CBS 962.96]|uniref:Uncharacterized protein n=1 Tax=Dendrothele bispora (strain CBS 962.96) TaxID=1314807 RepID=A0A4S8MFG9_DENBC|nr:hypothetical protein K435DRAFT_853895 [Dendrothele bispora CBS 962.96]